MPVVNRDTTLSNMLQDIEQRLRRIESAKFLNIPYLNTNPLNPSPGDMWINVSAGAHGVLYVRKGTSNVAIFNFAS
jgi:hypothetical protein